MLPLPFTSRVSLGKLLCASVSLICTTRLMPMSWGTYRTQCSVGAVVDTRWTSVLAWKVLSWAWRDRNEEHGLLILTWGQSASARPAPSGSLCFTSLPEFHFGAQTRWEPTSGFVHFISPPYTPAVPSSPLFLLIGFIYRSFTLTKKMSRWYRDLPAGTRFPYY